MQHSGHGDYYLDVCLKTCRRINCAFNVRSITAAEKWSTTKEMNWWGGGGRENLKKKSKNIEFIYEPRHEISNNVVCATSKGSD